ncbi:SiaB family protein kinase [Sulfurimonas sp. C5]|uniref:SiaB family protein kinase n=1 Tax=Sulfurimonas sp. C5 TaxID=3036947 RepID=UPI002456714D|nr:SiaB family protein kinase [Sulfurimonas sp. C5]MDH4944831.1 SiaB family protein kinase [Sulfurimonas sp. C5]
MKFDTLENILEEDGIVFLSYGGFLTQSLIAGMTDALEQEAQNNDLSMKVSANIFTIFIELAQNMMNYAKSKSDAIRYESKGLLIVGTEAKNNQDYYYIISRNLIDAIDKERIENRLKTIEGLDKEELRKLYREQRKAGKDKHHRGAGIGLIEIARRCNKIEHHFEDQGDGHFYFTVKTILHKEKGE